MAANYNYIAPIYDCLGRLIFGRHLVGAQTCMVPYIPASSRILIVGGGTGWLLEYIARAHAAGLTIDYVESSAGMIALAKARNYQHNVLNFVHLPIEDYIPISLYDVVITPFIFDNFKEERARAVFTKLDASLKENGLWLYADFVYDKSLSPSWQKILLRIMYFFFYVATGIETAKLISILPYFAAGYHLQFEALRYRRFIRSAVYHKASYPA